MEYDLEKVARYAYVDSDRVESTRELVESRGHLRSPVIFLTSVGATSLGLFSGCYHLVRDVPSISYDSPEGFVGIGTTLLLGMGILSMFKLRQGTKMAKKIYNRSRVNELVVKHGPRVLERKVVRKLIRG